MYTKLNSRMVALTVGIILLAGLTGCKDLFVNPLVDKETGDDITVLIVDQNFIKTKLVVRLTDYVTHEAIENEEVTVRFVGEDAGNLINFVGEKKTEYITSSGFIEIGYDPNIAISEEKTQVLTVIAISPNHVSAPQVIEFSSEGIKNLDIMMIRTNVGKAANSSVHGEPYDITFEGVKDNSELGFLSNISGMSTGTAYEYINAYSPSISGNLVCDNLTDPLLYEDFGMYYFRDNDNLLPPSAPSRNCNIFPSDFVYSSVKRSGIAKCNSGLKIKLARADGKAGSGTFDYVITFSDGSKKTGSLSCSFPGESVIEPIYYPSSNAAVTVELYGDSQYNFSPAVNLASACGNTAEFLAEPKSNLINVKVTMLYTCPVSRSIAIALSIGAQFRKTGTTGAWTDFAFAEGICSLLLEKNADYDFRVNVDGTYYGYTIPTDPAKVQALLDSQNSPDYSIRTMEVTETEFGYDISATIDLNAGICDFLN